LPEVIEWGCRHEKSKKKKHMHKRRSCRRKHNDGAVALDRSTIVSATNGVDQFPNERVVAASIANCIARTANFLIDTLFHEELQRNVFPVSSASVRSVG
jgi:hypothetical protein